MTLEIHKLPTNTALSSTWMILSLKFLCCKPAISKRTVKIPDIDDAQDGSHMWLLGTLCNNAMEIDDTFGIQFVSVWTHLKFIIATILEIIQLSRSLSSPQSTSLNSVHVIFSVLNVPPNLFFWNFSLFSKWLLQLATLPLIFFSARFPLDSV